MASIDKDKTHMNTLQQLLFYMARAIRNINEQMITTKGNAIYLENNRYARIEMYTHRKRSNLLVMRGVDRHGINSCLSTLRVIDDLYAPTQHINSTLSVDDNNLLTTIYKLFLRYKNQERLFDMYEIHAYHYSSNYIKYVEIGLYRNKLPMKHVMRIECYKLKIYKGAIANFITSFPENTRVILKPKHSL